MEANFLDLDGVKDCFEAAKKTDFEVCGNRAGRGRDFENGAFEEIEEPKACSLENGGWMGRCMLLK